MQTALLITLLEYIAFTLVAIVLAGPISSIYTLVISHSVKTAFSLLIPGIVVIALSLAVYVKLTAVAPSAAIESHTGTTVDGYQQPTFEVLSKRPADYLNKYVSITGTVLNARIPLHVSRISIYVTIATSSDQGDKIILIYHPDTGHQYHFDSGEIVNVKGVFKGSIHGKPAMTVDKFNEYSFAYSDRPLHINKEMPDKPK